jgi:hypothetical protein
MRRKGGVIIDKEQLEFAVSIQTILLDLVSKDGIEALDNPEIVKKKREQIVHVISDKINSKAPLNTATHLLDNQRTISEFSDLILDSIASELKNAITDTKDEVTKKAREEAIKEAEKTNPGGLKEAAMTAAKEVGSRDIKTFFPIALPKTSIGIVSGYVELSTSEPRLGISDQLKLAAFSQKVEDITSKNSSAYKICSDAFSFCNAINKGDERDVKNASSVISLKRQLNEANNALAEDLSKLQSLQQKEATRPEQKEGFVNMLTNRLKTIGNKDDIRRL